MLLLTSGLNIIIPCKKSDLADYLVNFKLYFKNMNILDILSKNDFGFLNQKLRKLHNLPIELTMMKSLKTF